jgi:translation initiation factor IF-3
MAEELKELAIIERNPLVEGRNMIMILSPTRKKAERPTKIENGRRSPDEAGITDEVVAAEAGAVATETATAVDTGRDDNDAEDQKP